MTDPLERIAEAAGIEEAAEEPAAKTGGILKRLFQRTEQQPADFDKALTARAANWGLDRVSRRPGLAAETEVGESLALCMDAMGAPTDPGGTPIAYLATSVFHYILELREAGATHQETAEPGPDDELDGVGLT